jgi:hypothetical protein
VICGVKNEICLYVSDMINNDIILGSGSICDYDLLRDPRSNLVMTRKQLLRTFQTQIAAREKQMCTHLDAKAERLGDMSWNQQTEKKKIYDRQGPRIEKGKSKTHREQSFVGQVRVQEIQILQGVSNSSCKVQNEKVQNVQIKVQSNANWQNGNNQGQNKNLQKVAKFQVSDDNKGSLQNKNLQNVAKTKSQVSEHNALPTITTNAQILNDNDMCVNGVKIINDASSKLMTHPENVNVGDEQGKMFCKKRICIPAKCGRKVVLYRKGHFG